MKIRYTHIYLIFILSNQKMYMRFWYAYITATQGPTLVFWAQVEVDKTKSERKWVLYISRTIYNSRVSHLNMSRTQWLMDTSQSQQVVYTSRTRNDSSTYHERYVSCKHHELNESSTHHNLNKSSIQHQLTESPTYHEVYALCTHHELNESVTSAYNACQRLLHIPLRYTSCKMTHWVRDIFRWLIEFVMHWDMHVYHKLN